MVITRKLKFDVPLLSMGGVNIEMSTEIKILGLTIDHQLTFNSHVAKTIKKVIQIYKQLSRAARISWGLHPEVVKTIYLATIEPVILYAACAWAPASTKVGIVKKLNFAQRGFAQKVTRAYRTASLNSALVLAGILPLDIRVREAAQLYEVKRGVPWPALGDKRVECRAPVLQKPHPAEHMSCEFVSLNTEQEVGQHTSHPVKIFTDGSKLEGKVGAALSIWNDDSETKTLKLKLASHCSVYQAELLAICKATEEILKGRNIDNGVYSDSRSALQSIASPNTTNPLARKAQANIRAINLQKKTVSFYWIKAHAGFQGNERADHLAKEAALKSKKRPDYEDCPISFAKRMIRQKSLDEWNRRYKSGNTANTTKIFFPDAKEAFAIIKKLPAHNVQTQVLTGHGGFSEYLYKFKCSESPACVCDDSTNENIEHILFNCPVFAQKRFDLENELNIEIKRENANKLLTNKNTRNKFIEFCINIAEIVIKKNKTL